MILKADYKFIWHGLAELLVWSSLAFVFLGLYIAGSSLPIEVLGEHLRIYAACVAGLWLLRLSAAALLSGWSARFAQAFLTLAFLLFWLCFYGLVLVGLRNWGEVITLDILSVYVQQADTLLTTLGISLWVLMGGLLVLTGICLVSLSALHKHHWIEQLAVQLSWHKLVPAVFGLLALMMLEFFSFHFRLGLPTNEPLALMLKDRRQNTEQVLSVDGSAGEQMRQQAMTTRQNYLPTPDPLKANVILIVVDALRDDHLGVNGYERETTPNLQRWLRQTGGLTLGQARSACASSICGITSIVSSRFSHQQTPEAMSLHEVLALHGWKTHLILGGDHTNFYGLRQRYGRVDSYVDGTQATPTMLNDDRFILESLNALVQKTQEPSLIHLHLMSAHVLGRRFLQSGVYGLSSNYSNPLFKLKADHVQQAVNYYDEGVLQTDHVIDQALQNLQRAGFLKRALVLITGDHGEHLGEQGRFSHANGILEPAVRVPWIMLPFGIDLASMDQVGRRHQVDMAPTVLDLLHIQKPVDWVGVSLLEKNRQPPFSYLRQGTEVALIDHRDPNTEYKYSIEAIRGVERVIDLVKDSHELSFQQPNSILMQEWRTMLLPQILTVARTH